MKRYLIYTLLIISSICYGQIYSISKPNIQYNGFQSTSYYNRPIRRYNNNYNSCENYNNSKFGYRTSIGYSTYKADFNLNSIYGSKTYYIPSYSSDPNYSNKNSSYKGGPRRVSGDEGWTTWNEWGMRHGVPSDASNEDMYTYYNAWEKNNSLSWEDWYISIYGIDSESEAPISPENPYMTPVGEFPIGLILILSFLFVYYKKFKNKLIEL